MVSEVIYQSVTWFLLELNESPVELNETIDKEADWLSN